MAKQTKQTKHILINKSAFLKVRTEFYPISDTEGLYFKEIGGRELLEYREFVQSIQVEANTELKIDVAMKLMAKFISLSACDENGLPIFNAEDVPLLEQKQPSLLLDMANFAMDLAGMKSELLGKVVLSKK